MLRYIRITAPRNRKFIRHAFRRFGFVVSVGGIPPFTFMNKRVHSKTKTEQQFLKILLLLEGHVLIKVYVFDTVAHTQKTL